MTDDKKNANDEALFREAMAGVQSITDERAPPFQKKRPPKPLNLSHGEKEGDELGDLAVDTPDFLEFRRPGIQHRVFQDLQRGLIEVEDSLDLHGMRVVDARPAFSRFIKHSLKHGLRCIRIIHGKGRGSDGQQPVLKQKTNQWLQQKEEVLAFAAAPRWDGGTGAVYVLLSRKYRQET